MKLRNASKKGHLICVECGNTLGYYHGDVQQPHFRHKNALDCSYSDCDYQYSEEYLKAMSVIHRWLKTQYDSSVIKISEVIPGTRYRPRFLVEGDEKIVIDYIRYDRELDKFIERIDCLDSLGYKSFILFSAEVYYHNKKGDLYSWVGQNHLQDGIAFFLDLDNKSIILQKIINVVDKKKMVTVRQCIENKVLQLDTFTLRNLDDVTREFLIQANDKYNSLLDDYSQELAKFEKRSLTNFQVNKKAVAQSEKKPVFDPKVITTSYSELKQEKFPYNKERYRKLLVDDFKSLELTSADVYELMAYVRQNNAAFIKVFPDKNMAIRCINKYLGGLNDFADRSPFVEFKNYVSSLK